MLRIMNTASLCTIIMGSLLIIGGMMFGSQSQAASPAARAALKSNPNLLYAPDSVLIRFKAGTHSTQKQQARQMVNGQMLRGFGLVNALEHIQLGPGRSVEKAIEILQTLPFVSYVEPDYVIRADTSDPLYSLQWGLENTGQDILGTAGIYDADINADLAWSVTTGSPDVVVAVIDTGVDYTHADLTANMWQNPDEIPANGIDDDGNGYIDDVYGYDFFSGDNDPMDEEGHGTHVSGTICADSNNGVGVSGVAWECRIMALRFIGPNGGYTSDAIRALEYAVAKHVVVSNNSWGGGSYSQSMYDALSLAGGDGHLFIAAAGNGGIDGIGDNTDLTAHYPSSYDSDNVIAVAATDNRDELARFSNYGLTSVDVGAPGVGIVSTMSGAYYYASGTSMAAPHVTGVVALILSLHPDWTYSDLKMRILNSVRSVAALSGKTVTGGVVDANLATSEPATIPVAPDQLTAFAASHEQIDLSWVDNSGNEQGFRIERSLSGGNSWSPVGTVAANVESYSDSGLSAESSYDYRVYAYNSTGNSDFSNVASATTTAVPTGQRVVASSEILTAGTVLGTYQATWEDDTTYQSITERKSGGKPSTRYSYLQHTWLFNIPAGVATVSLNAWSDESTDEDRFMFSYSLDGNVYHDMFPVYGGDSESWYQYPLPSGVNGTFYIRVTDTDRSAGNLEFNTITVDQLFVWIENDSGTVPETPANLSGVATEAGPIELTWQDNATDEMGFEIERALTGTGNWSTIGLVNANVVMYRDETVQSDTAYDYRIRAYNSAGYSDYSAIVSVTSLPFASLELTSTSHVAGWQYVNLFWNNAELVVDVYRDGSVIATVSGGTYSDAKIGKGSASYTYWICETGTNQCSNTVVVTF